MKTTVKGVVLLLLLFAGGNVYTSIEFPPSGKTNAPGEANCTNCHYGQTVTSGPVWNSITLAGLPEAGYLPDSLYTLTLSGGHAATMRNGFQLTALDSSNQMAGLLYAGTGSLSQMNMSRIYLSHHNADTQALWQVKWKPQESAGRITFYLCYNGSNANNHYSGDTIYIKTFQVRPYSLRPTAHISQIKGTFCAMDTLEVDGEGIHSPTSFNWFFGGALAYSTNGSKAKVIYGNAGTRKIKLLTQNNFGFSDTSETVINIHPVPDNSLLLSKDFLCMNDSVLATSVADPGSAFLWMPGNFNKKQVYLSKPGKYVLTVTGISGCVAKSDSFLISDKQFAVQLAISADTVCEDEPVKLKAISEATHFSFYDGSFLLNEGLADSIQMNAKQSTDSLHVIGSTSYCKFTSSYLSLRINKNLTAPVVKCTPGRDSIRFYWEPVDGAVFYRVSTDSGAHWIASSEPLAHTILGLQSGEQIRLIVKGTRPDSCSSDSQSSIACSTNLPIGMPSLSTSLFTIYPNPSSGICAVVMNEFLKDIPFELLDQTGKCLMKGQLQYPETRFDLKDWSKGIYTLRTMKSDLVFHQLLVIE